MIGALFVLWFALIAADRIDFLARSGPFLLTPFLVLTPVVIAAELGRRVAARDAVALPQGALRYAGFATALLALTLVSSLTSGDVALSAKRAGLLIYQLYGTLLVAVLLLGRADGERILVRGAYLGIAVATVFNLLQLGLWLAGKNAEAGVEPGVFFITSWVYGPWAPRLSGPVGDMNRGGLLLLVYLFVLLRFAPRARLRSFAVALTLVSIAATLSRSTMLALAVLAALLLVGRRRVVVSPAGLLAGMLGLSMLAAVVLFNAEMLRGVLGFLAPLSQRLTGDHSSSVHAALLRYGLEVATSGLRTAFLGVGFGNAGSVLEEFYPGDKYANFHSLYISYWVESGIVAFFVGTLLLVWPLSRSTRYRPVLAGFAVFNLFYQTTLEPVFWFVLALAWQDLVGPGLAGWRRTSLVATAGLELAPGGPTAALQSQGGT